MLWQVYHSSDNLNWFRVEQVVSFWDAGFLHYRIQFPETTDRYFKAVNVTANPAEIYVLRGRPGLSPVVDAWRLDIRNAANMVLSTRFELRPNDIVFVAEQPVTRWGRVIDQISPSLISSSIATTSN